MDRLVTLRVCGVLILTLLVSCGSDVADPAPIGLDPFEVVRKDLDEQVTVTGSIGYGEAWSPPICDSGLVTRPVEEGRVVAFGEVLVWLDERPVLLLPGEVPVFREMEFRTAKRDRVSGQDVEQLQDALIAAGYVSEDRLSIGEFDQTTRDAVRAFQSDVGMEVSGRVGPCQIVFEPKPLRIGQSIRAGTTFESLRVSAKDPHVTVVIQDAVRRFFALGTNPVITISGTTVSGEVTRLTVASDESPGSESGAWIATIEVGEYFEPASGEVVRVTGREVLAEDVVAIPASAIVTTVDGSLAVERQNGELVAVDVGIAADGWIEIEDPLVAGDTIMVPK